MRLRHPAALVDLDEAVDYLESERSGFGALFFDEVAKRIGQAARLPRSGAPIMGFDDRLDVRQFVVRRFHIVVTAVVKDERLVVAIAHTRREPRYWRYRGDDVETGCWRLVKAR